MSPLPDVDVIVSLQMLIWTSIIGDISLMNKPTDIHKEFEKVQYSTVSTEEGLPQIMLSELNSMNFMSWQAIQ